MRLPRFGQAHPAFVELNLFAAPARDQHAIAGVDVEVIRHVTHFDALRRFTLDVIHARLIDERDRRRSAIERDAVADPFRGGVASSQGLRWSEFAEELPFAGVARLFKDQRRRIT